MSFAQKGRISVSSWSLHRRLGPVWNYLPGGMESVQAETPYGNGQTSLLDLPAELRAHNIFNLEICSFHLESLSQSYLDELKSSLKQAGVGLQTLLIEAGDPASAETGERDIGFMQEWVERAAYLDAGHARVIAGKQAPTRENLERALRNLVTLAERVQHLPVKLVTENWFSLLSGPDETNWLLDRANGLIGLNGDLGNWPAPHKYEGLKQIMGRAILCHAKAGFSGGKLDEDDFGRSISISEEAGYRGPYTLIYDSGDLPEWDGLQIEKDFIEGRISLPAVA
ncbi:MAG: sugar phosphate isomerase/epimerase [Hyphomicrobiaceae bacterium]|nr:sugar phosphate isomerase/epimerase [Hyphomicrobiaceae bacterium]MCC0024339.1 sugar phosphate isomerase/epimerase [Hyphomicrobiaceae bacterium]